MRALILAGSFAIWAGLTNISVSADDRESNDRSPQCSLTVAELLCKDRSELEVIYKSGAVPIVPAGKIRGTAIVAPGSCRNPRLSRASRVMWQGKVFCPECSTATNKFFGIRIIKGQLSTGESWMDQGSALILDYRETSVIYGNMRDEIREVSPGLYLGAMYEERDCCRTFKTFFVLEAPCASQ